MRKIGLSVFVFLLAGQLAFSQDYIISFPHPETHYAHVKAIFKNWKGGNLDIHLPVWAPGSYLVREFSKNVESLSAVDLSGNSLKVNKTRKNIWTIQASKGDVTVDYDVYANELSVRTSFIDAEHAYLNGTSVFVFAKEYLSKKANVTIMLAANWKTISVALDKVPNIENTFTAANYDDLVDAPFEIGNHKVFSFTSCGVHHEVAMYGQGNYGEEQLKKDMAVITEQALNVFGGPHPCKNYLFIIHNLNNGGGGLEHKNSTTLQTDRNGYTGESYKDFLTLVAHEYFHLWNVKRMRPKALGPFDYDNENYTNLLFVSEGFTAYYEDLIVFRSGFFTRQEFLQKIANSFSYSDNQLGATIQPLNEASFDAWIKYYRPNENSANSTVSYYSKGAAVAAALDMIIRTKTNGKKSLDDVMQVLYQTYYLGYSRGFTDMEFQDAVSQIAGINMNDFFKKYVFATNQIPFDTISNEIGLVLDDNFADEEKVYLGFNSTASKNTISSVERNSPAWLVGLNVGDEIIAINDYRFNGDLNASISNVKINDYVNVLVSRNGVIKKFTMKAINTPYVSYFLELTASLTENQKKVLKGWLGEF
ncbi:MAG: M61 family metallopeptidase [Bacteroidota bacterium]